MDEQDNILNFEKNSQQIDIKQKKIKQTLCRHSKTTLDEVRRLVVCSLCNQHIEPYDFIYKIAKREVVMRSNIKQLKHEKADLAGEIERLKKDRNNIKAQINRLNKRLS